MLHLPPETDLNLFIYLFPSEYVENSGSGAGQAETANQEEILCRGRGTDWTSLFESSTFDSEMQDSLLLIVDQCLAKKLQVTEPGEMRV